VHGKFPLVATYSRLLLHKLPADVPEAELFALIDQLNADPNVHGILCQFPVPDHLNERDVVARIDPGP